MSEIQKKVSMGSYLKNKTTQEFLSESLTEEKKGQFISNLLALIDANSNLSECDPNELMMCALNSTALDLPLNNNLGYAYVIPYKNHKTGKSKPQFQIGAKGYKQLAIRSGQYKTINAVEIREGELSLNKFSGEFQFLKENPNGKIVGYFAFFRLLNGYEKCLYMTTEKLQAHALKYSKSYAYDVKSKTKTSKWSTDEKHEMSLKTVSKLLLSREGVLSVKMSNAIAIDSNDEYDNGVSGARNTVPEAEVIEQTEPTTIEQKEVKPKADKKGNDSKQQTINIESV